MKRLVIISNRAPVTIEKENGTYRYKKSAGGLASGLSAYVAQLKKANSELQIVWMGWPGRTVEDEKTVHADILKKFGVHSVFLSEQLMENFYRGFCNKTIWPLFHYFPVYTIYNKKYWEEYILVNEIFCEAALKIIRPGDEIWIQDYHLMLLPEMIRRKKPEASIGFFLHIPFPAYEVFRLLPSQWRKQILQGIYGADLIGFHTFDYRTYFLRSTLNILGITQHMGDVLYENRLVKVDSFPMGIDFNKYHQASQIESTSKKSLTSKGSVSSSNKFILSIDRQDYTKGILNRLRAYEHFLQTNPSWLKRVTMMLVVVPSRIGVESYIEIKSKIDELVGHINGTYGNFEWLPINYQYRSLSFDELVALYKRCDIALITPLRDGMNLIAKEFIASRTNDKGVLILSEMTGAAQELTEAIIINPNNIEEISEAMLEALEMKNEEQKRRLDIMQKRIQTYTVFEWAADFLNSLITIKKKQVRLSAKVLGDNIATKIIAEFKKAASRVIFLDYDGTLVEHTTKPEVAAPDKKLLSLLKRLASKKNLSVVLISGRDKSTLDKWFGRLSLELVAEHGVFIKEKSKSWQLLKPVRKNWKKKIIPRMEWFTEKLSGSFIEEKEYSVAFHYRNSEPALASLRVKELINHLMSLTANMDIQLVNGSKTLEVRNSGIDKGVAVMHRISQIIKNPRFILAIGNDQTDEDIFRSLPKDAHSIKVGMLPSYADHNLNSIDEVRSFLKKFL